MFLRVQWWNIPIPSQPMNDMKAAKYSGNYADLNIYTTMMQNNLLGCDRTARVTASLGSGFA